MTFHRKGTQWLCWSVTNNSSQFDTLYRSRVHSPETSDPKSVLLRHRNDLAYHIFMLRKKQRDLERKISDHSTYLKECAEKFEIDKCNTKTNKGKRLKMTFKCSTCNKAGWNKLPELKAAAQTTFKENAKTRKWRKICDTAQSSASDQ